MIIAQISDTHITLDADDADQRIKDFEAVIADINMLDPQPDFIVHTGDIVHNGRQAEYAKAVEILSKSNAPVYAIVGNKDDRLHMREAFTSFGFISTDSEFIDYAIDDFPIRLIMLDTLQLGSNKGDFCAKRQQNLSEMMSTGDEKPTAVFMHHPPCEVDVGPHPFHFESQDTMSELRNLLTQADDVISIFSGHVHRSTIGYIEDIPVNVMSAVATTLRWGEYSEHTKSLPAYEIHRFDEELGFVSETRIVGI